MIARQDDHYEGIKFPVGDRDVGYTKRCYDFHAKSFEVGSPVHDHRRVTIQARFKELRDLGFARCEETGNSESLPPLKSPTEPLGV